MGATGLIGYSGFVGGTLAKASHWDALFNSQNVEQLCGQEFDLLVCAGVPAVKWLANKDPEADRAGIARLTKALGHAKARELVLISTIDVYPDPARGDDERTALDPMANHPYGRHRLQLEQWAADRFETLRIVRLPALFGPGLRKNALFDLLHGNMVENINPAGVFQWYSLDRLWRDISTVRTCGIPLVNLFPEPLPMSRIIATCFRDAKVGAAIHPAPIYDVHTRHGRKFGGGDHYIMGADAVMADMVRFIAAERSK